MKAKPAKRNVGKYVRYGLFTLVTGAMIAVSSAYYLSDISHKTSAAKMESEFFATKTDLEKDLEKAKSEYEALKKEDQRVRNDKLEKEIQDIQKTYKDSVTAYEKLLKLKERTNKTAEFDERSPKSLLHYLTRIMHRRADSSRLSRPISIRSRPKLQPLFRSRQTYRSTIRPRAQGSKGRMYRTSSDRTWSM